MGNSREVSLIKGISSGCSSGKNNSYNHQERPRIQVLQINNLITWVMCRRLMKFQSSMQADSEKQTMLPSKLQSLHDMSEKIT